LSDNIERFQDFNTKLYAILPDNAESAKNFEASFAKKFPIYYDPKKKVNKMLKQEVKPFKLGRMPALIIIDKNGIIKYAYYSDSMDDIPSNDAIFEVLNNLKP
jgi:peroxiredoxin Q/BCP